MSKHAKEERVPLQRPLQEVSLVVLLADADASCEVVWVGNGLKDVGLDQSYVIQLRDGGCSSVSTAGVHEHLIERHTHTPMTARLLA